MKTVLLALSLYSTPSLDLTVTSLPSLVCTVYGSLSKFSIFVFFSKTRSSGATGLSVAPRLLSACSLWINLWFQLRWSLTPNEHKQETQPNSFFNQVNRSTSTNWQERQRNVFSENAILYISGIGHYFINNITSPFSLKKTCLQWNNQTISQTTTVQSPRQRP